MSRLILSALLCISAAVGASTLVAEARPVGATAHSDVSALVAVLDDTNATIQAQRDACAKLAELGAAAKSAVPALIGELLSPEQALRESAVTALSKIGAGAADALPSLRQVARNDASEEVRALAADAIKVIAAPVPAAQVSRNPISGTDDHPIKAPIPPSDLNNPLGLNANSDGAAQTLAVKMSLPRSYGWSFDRTLVLDLPDGKATDVRKGSAIVLKSDNGTPSELALSFDKDCNTTITRHGGNTSKSSFPLAGQKLAVGLDSQGKLTSDYTGKIDSDTIIVLKGLLGIQDHGLSPERPSPIGAQWRGGPAAQRGFSELVPGDSPCTVDCKLLGVQKMDSGPALQISIKLAAQVPQGDRQFTGTAWIDQETGLLVREDLSGSGPGPGGTVIPFTYHLIARPLGELGR